jgi:hypothetical protein
MPYRERGRQVQEDLLMPDKESIHDLAIIKLARDHKGFETKGFAKAMRAIPDVGDDPELSPENLPRMIPDGYVIDHENRAVIVFEVEDTHPMNREKLSKYWWLWWVLDEYFWSLVVVVCDRYGRGGAIDLYELGMAHDQDKMTKRGAKPSNLISDSDIAREDWLRVAEATEKTDA